jgi:rhodanese-related sulfurtransferase
MKLLCVPFRTCRATLKLLGLIELAVLVVELRAPHLPFAPLAVRSVACALANVASLLQFLHLLQKPPVSPPLSTMPSMAKKNDAVPSIAQGKPQSVQQLSAPALKSMIDNGVSLRLIDVRTAWEFEIASVSGARLLDAAYRREVMQLPRDTNLVFVCHHGIRSQFAAGEFYRMGFSSVFNVEGGIEAWSETVDKTVPRY